MLGIDSRYDYKHCGLGLDCWIPNPQGLRSAAANDISDSLKKWPVNEKTVIEQLTSSQVM